VATVSRVLRSRASGPARSARAGANAIGGDAYAIGDADLRLPEFLPADYGVALSLFSYFGTMGHLTSGLPSNNCATFRRACVHQGQYGIPCVGWPWRQLEIALRAHPDFLLCALRQGKL